MQILLYFLEFGFYNLFKLRQQDNYILSLERVLKYLYIYELLRYLIVVIYFKFLCYSFFIGKIEVVLIFVL